MSILHPPQRMGRQSTTVTRQTARTAPIQSATVPPSTLAAAPLATPDDPPIAPHRRGSARGGTRGTWSSSATLPGETGVLARDVARTIDELRQTTTEFSIGAARSAVSVGVIGAEVERLPVER